MQNPTATPYSTGVIATGESSRSAVAWGAIIAGAVIAAALSAMLVSAGTGLGFLAISPWQQDGASAKTLAIGTIVWLLITQIIAYGIAGYVTGRLRTKWTDAAVDEVHFRDTAHGFLVWALSAVIWFVLVGSSAMSAISGTAKVGATAVGAASGGAVAAAGSAMSGQGGQSGQGSGMSMDYFTDTLLRPADPTQAQAGANPADTRAEITRILTRSAANGQMSDTDRDYLTKLVAQRTGVDQATAQQRITQVTDQAKQAAQQAEQKAREAADQARKAAALLSLWVFASLLIGAFICSWFATVGGRARDRF
jgi:hypothetical protein